MADRSRLRYHPFHQSVQPTNSLIATTPSTLSPEIIVAGMADLLGFHPEDSLIVVGLSVDPQRPVVATLRVDLPSVDDLQDRADLVTWLSVPLSAAASRCDSMIVLVWSNTTARENAALIDEVAGMIASTGTCVADGLIVSSVPRPNDAPSTNWRSLWCAGASCCDEFGNHLTNDHREAAARIFSRAGRVPAASRTDLERELAARSPQGRWSSPGDLPRDAFDVAVIHAVSLLRTGGAPSSVDSVLLAQALCDVRVRDTVIWEMLTYPEADWTRAADVLTHIVRSCPQPFLSPLATCLAIFRWQLGDGVRAMIAIEHALAADPHYALAQLIGGCITHGVHPAEWRGDLHCLKRQDLSGP